MDVQVAEIASQQPLRTGVDVKPQLLLPVHELFDQVAARRLGHPAIVEVEPGSLRGSAAGSQRCSQNDSALSGRTEGGLETRQDQGGVVWTYQELGERVRSVTMVLQSIWRRTANNRDSEKAVVILVDEGVGLAVSELAAMKSGAAFVPVDPNWPAQRIAFIIRDCAASAVIVSRAGAANCADKMRSAGLDTTENLTDEDLDAIPTVLIEQAMSAHAEDIATHTAPAEDAVHRACHIIYTSGSTGQPKGVVCEHCSLLSYVRGKASAHGIDETSRVLVAAASTWDPSVGDLFCALLAGATACVAGRAALVEDLHGVLQASRATHLSTTPALWGLLPSEARPCWFPDLAVLALGGERMPLSLVRRWGTGEGGLRLLNTYGVTEATVYQTVHELRGGPGGDADVLAGKALDGVMLAVDGDPEREGGRDGEILIGGVQVARGYLNRPDLTAAKFFSKDGTRWFRSGDLGRWVRAGGSEDGNGARPLLQVLGRMDLQVKLRGFRIELEEVQTVIRQCPLVRNAAVVLHHGQAAGEASGEAASRDGPSDEKTSSASRLVAFVEMSEEDLAGFEAGGEVAVRLHCQQRMPAFQVPAQLIGVGRLPMTDSGKLDRAALPAPPPITARGPGGLLVSEAARRVSPQTLALEKTVGGVWGRVLGVERVGPWDHFWELGGNSVLAVRMLHALEATLGDEVAPATSGRWASTREDRARVRLCGLHRKPRLKDFVRFLEWAAVTAPNARHDAGSGDSVIGVERERRGEGVVGGVGEEGGAGGADLLGRLDAERPETDDTADVQRAAVTMAAEGGHAGVLWCLLAQGASAEGWAETDRRSESPLLLAARGGHVAAVRALMGGGASGRGVDAMHNNALHLAAAGGHVAVVEELLTVGSQVPRDARTLHKWSAAHHAAFHGHRAVLHVLKKHGASVNLKDRWGRTPLAWAVFNRHVAAAEDLIAEGGGLLEGGEHGRNQPQMARQRRLGNRWSPAITLAVQAEVRAARREEGEEESSATESGGKSAGAREGGLGVLRLMLRHRETLQIKVDAVDAEGRTALHQACIEGGVARLLGDDGSAGEGDGEGPGGTSARELVADSPSLQKTPSRGVVQCTCAIIQSLIQHGANVNVRDLQGQTPLHCAAAVASSHAVQVLLRHGADANLRDKRGMTALDLAERGGHRGQEEGDYRGALLLAMESASGGRPLSHSDPCQAGLLVSGVASKQVDERSGRRELRGLRGWVAEQNTLMGASFFVVAERN